MRLQEKLDAQVNILMYMVELVSSIKYNIDV